MAPARGKSRQAQGRGSDRGQDRQQTLKVLVTQWRAFSRSAQRSLRWFLRRVSSWMLVIALALPLTAGALPLPSPASTSTAPSATHAASATGSFQLATVRILGIPVITVASPELHGDGRAVSAEERARVIEGNLTWLYEPRTLCSGGESLAETFLEQGFLHGQDRACSSDHLALGGPPEALRVEVQRSANGSIALVALTPGRQQPWPLLTVTAEDARLNGTTEDQLANRWAALLQRRLRYARRVLQPQALTQQWHRVLLAEAVLAVLLTALVAALMASRRLTRRLMQGPPVWLQGRPRLESLVIHAAQNLSRASLLLAALTVLVMAGGLAFAVPSQLPLALDLVLQPGGLLLKLLGLWLLTLAARTVLAVLLGQWRSNVDVLPEARARRNQRYRSLKRVLGRLVDLVAILAGAVWILSDIPGVQALSAAAVVAGGALLGALAIVFQGLLRDFVAGLVVIFDDRYAIGDTVEINGLTGDVVDVGLLSTELRCADQRVVVLQNSGFEQVVNHTKLRSGIDVRLPLSPALPAIDAALAVVREELTAFSCDPEWRDHLLAPPQLRGVDEVNAECITVSVLLCTQAGLQWPARRALLQRLLARLEREGIPLANRERNWLAR